MGLQLRQGRIQEAQCEVTPARVGMHQTGGKLRAAGGAQSRSVVRRRSRFSHRQRLAQLTAADQQEEKMMEEQFPGPHVRLDACCQPEPDERDQFQGFFETSCGGMLLGQPDSGQEPQVGRSGWILQIFRQRCRILGEPVFQRQEFGACQRHPEAGPGVSACLVGQPLLRLFQQGPRIVRTTANPGSCQQAQREQPNPQVLRIPASGFH